MPAHGQIQDRVRRIEVGHTGRAAGDPGDGDRPEHGGQLALVTSFGPDAHHTVGVSRTLGEPLFTGGPQFQVVLEQAAHQLPRALGELILKRSMGQLTTTRISQPGHHLLEQPPGPINAPASACPDPACCAYPDTGLLLICHVLVIDTPNVAGRSPSSDQDTRKTAGHAPLGAHFRRAPPIGDR
jgi:hypothetical protein